MEKEIKVGDYVEVLSKDDTYGNTYITSGEQGVVIDDSAQAHIQVIFPARSDLWAENGWRVTAKELKIVYRPRRRKHD